ncbi:hypothetical protein LZ31DRAFT_81768 [Colletotrichum somersetense]|nr:hypothetical protein LZ31DRAFT_81768 [Colletotrichum somersetense]
MSNMYLYLNQPSIDHRTIHQRRWFSGKILRCHPAASGSRGFDSPSAHRVLLPRTFLIRSSNQFILSLLFCFGMCLCGRTCKLQDQKRKQKHTPHIHTYTYISIYSYTYIHTRMHFRTAITAIRVLLNGDSPSYTPKGLQL